MGKPSWFEPEEGAETDGVWSNRSTSERYGGALTLGQVWSLPGVSAGPRGPTQDDRTSPPVSTCPSLQAKLSSLFRLQLEVIRLISRCVHCPDVSAGKGSVQEGSDAAVRDETPEHCGVLQVVSW